MKKVSILILTYNRLQTTEKFVPTIIDRIGGIDAEVLIWDNGSTDGSYDWVESFAQANCRVTKAYNSETNYGVEATNFLAREATGEYIIKIDDDVFPPGRFAERLVAAYEVVKEDKLAYLGWDMPWAGKTFATRSGMRLYKKPYGKIVEVDPTSKVYISFSNNSWMVNGVCRLSLRKKFLELGGHPKGVKYGVDSAVTRIAKKNGYWIGFYGAKDLVQHMPTIESTAYRALKDDQLKKIGAPLHV